MSDLTSSPQKQTGNSSLRLNVADATGIALLAVSFLVLSYLRSRHRIFWGDEMFSVLTLREPNWAARLHVWRAGLDSGGMWFYVFGYPWIKLFGLTEVSLREFSAVAIAASAGVIWVTARRYYSTLPVAAAVTLTYGSMIALRWQLANGRMYGIFMLSIALILYLILRGEEADQTRPTPGFLAATLASYCLLAGSHILATVYIITLVLIQFALDFKRGRLRWSLYLTACCSFAVIAFSLANIMAIAANGKPSFWAVPPTLMDLLNLSTAFAGKRVPEIVAALFVLGAFNLRKVTGRMPIYFILIGFAGLDVFLFAYSHVATPIYVDRYLLPFAFVAIFLVCELLSQIRDWEGPYKLIRAGMSVVVLLVGFSSLARPSFPPGLPYPDYTPRLLAALPPGLAVIDPDNGSFLDIHFYHPESTRPRFIYPVDWEVALDPSIKRDVSGHHEMDNFKAIGWYANDIMPYQQALDQQRDFIVLATPGNQLWMERRILSNPRFKATLYGHFKKEHTETHGEDDPDIWVVHTL